MPMAPSNWPVPPIPGQCRWCGELRPCSCGRFCPVCMADVEEKPDGSVVCTGCKRELRKRS